MHQLLALVPLPQLAAAFAVTFFAGFVKGSVGFAMPLIMVSGLTLFLDPLLVIAGIIFPIVVSNGLQVARFGAAEAMSAIREHRRYIIIVCVMILVSAQFLRIIPQTGDVPCARHPGGGADDHPDRRVQVPGRARTQGGRGMGRGPRFRHPGRGWPAPGGPRRCSTCWRSIRPRRARSWCRGVVYGLGAVTLLVAHLQSGILNWSTAPFSALLSGARGARHVRRVPDVRQDRAGHVPKGDALGAPPCRAQPPAPRHHGLSGAGLRAPAPPRNPRASDATARGSSRNRRRRCPRARCARRARGERRRSVRRMSCCSAAPRSTR